MRVALHYHLRLSWGSAKCLCSSTAGKTEIFLRSYARNRESAIIELDEVGDAELGELFTVKNFMVHFKLKEEIPEDTDELLPVDLEDFGEETYDALS